MPDGASESSERNATVWYEEDLAIRDDKGAGELVGWIRIIVAFLIISSLVSVLLVAVVVTQGLATSVGGMAVLQQFVGQLVAKQSIVVASFALAGLLFLLIGVGFVWLLVNNVGRALNKEVHIQVNDEGVSVERKGAQYWQSSGVDIPFESITSVEYVDPEESSFHYELNDFRAPKFFAGRSKDWVRLNRSNGPAVFIGSDQPQQLAETIAEQIPGNVTAKPF